MSGSVFLIGMPGCGKSSLGRAAAGMAGCAFVDVDEGIEREHGPIPAIFERGGEALFRTMETKALRQACEAGAAIVSCGGGIVLRQENLELMRAAGRVVFIDRPLEAILSDIRYVERPLLKGGEAALRALAAARLPLYRACAGETVDNSGAFEQARDAIVRIWEGKA